MTDVVDRADVGDVAEAALLGLPDELTREYEMRLTRLAQEADTPGLVKRLRQVLDDAIDEDTAYAAFYCLNVVYRRNRDYTLLEQLIVTNEARFGRRPTFRHLQVLFTIDRGVGKRKEELIRWAFEDAEMNPSNAGYVHLFADVVASLAEESDADLEREIVANWLSEALQAVDRAIRLDSRYAKYYATKARLLALSGQFHDSLELISTAIDMEDSTRPDYAIRLGEYQSRRLWIQARRSDHVFAQKGAEAALALEGRYASLRDELEKATKKIDESTVRNLEFLGFFAGLISFTIASIQIAASQTADDAIRLIIVLTGGLLVAFAGFGAILESSRLAGSIVRMGAVGAVGVAVVALGVLM